MHTNQPTNIPQTAGRTNSKLLTFDFLRLTLPQRPLLQRSIEVCLFCKQLRIILIGWEKGAQKWKVSGLTTRTILRDSCRKKKSRKANNTAQSLEKQQQQLLACHLYFAKNFKGRLMWFSSCECFTPKNHQIKNPSLKSSIVDFSSRLIWKFF